MVMHIFESLYFHFRNALGHKIVGCPVCIEDKKYKRNALMFNVCLVFNSSTRLTHIYGPAVKKLATYLTQLEVGASTLDKSVL